MDPSAPSASSASQKIWWWADVAALVGLAVAMALIVQPWWEGGLRWGFWAMLVATAAHIVTSHVVRPEDGR